MVALSSARRRVGTFDLSDDAVSGVSGNEVDDLLHRRARQEHASDAERLQLRDVDVRNDPADDDEHIVQAPGFEELHQLRRDVVVRPGQDRQADDVGVLLQRGADDLLRPLTEARVDDLHARITQRARDDFGAAIVAVQSWFRDDNSNLLQMTATSSYSPQT